jgi:putative tryptophan/tyrosine transport system substrate-binding protein
MEAGFQQLDLWLYKEGFSLDDKLKHVGRGRLVRRRELLGLVGGLVLSPRVSRAQQSLPIIGFLHYGSITHTGPQVAAFSQGLNQAGFVENRNIAISYCWGDGNNERLSALALDLLRQKVSIIVAGGAPSVAAVRQVAGNVPIVFVAASGSAGGGLNLGRPEGNITGISLASPDLLAERFQTLLKLIPAEKSVAVLINPQTPNIDVQLGYFSDAAKRRGIHAQVIKASDETDFAAALDEIAQQEHEALVVGNDGFLNGERDRLVALTRTNKIPAAFANREFVEAGGLMSYGPSLIEAYRQAGAYAGRILNGEKPANLPVESPLEMELALNAQAAKSLGLEVPPTLLADASEVVR